MRTHSAPRQTEVLALHSTPNRYIRAAETSRPHVLTTAQHTTYAADCHLTQPKRVRLTSPSIPTRYASIYNKVQAPPIFPTSSMSFYLSPISNSATHPLKFFWLRISLRKTTAHPLSYACKQAKGFSRCKHLMRIYSQKEVALRSTATAVL